MTKLHPCAMEETARLRYGDIFTITADTYVPNSGMVVHGDAPRRFVAVPLAYVSSNRVRRRWDAAIKDALRQGRSAVLCRDS